jgi:hypothetical protein
VYRAAAVPDEWLLAVDGADITTGTVTAAALAADFVLANLFRTAGSGNRVELEGNGHDFPFWVGSGTKGTASGTPGAGAKVYYDADADKFYVTGELVASRLRASASNVLDVISSGGYSAAVISQLTTIGDVSLTSGGYPTYTTVATIPTLYHPGNSGGVAANKLQSVDQPFIVDLVNIGKLSASGSGSSINVVLKFQYSYDSGTWTDVGSPSIDNLVYFCDASEVARPCEVRRQAYTFKAKAAGWSSTLQLRVVAAEADGNHAARLITSATLLLPNLGSQGITASQIG